MKEKILILCFLSMIFSGFLLTNYSCSDDNNGSDSGTDTDQYTYGTANVSARYTEALTGVRKLHYWAFKSSDFTEDCMSIFDVTQFTSTAEAEEPYTQEEEEAHSNKIHVFDKLPHEEYHFIIRGYDDQDNLIAFGCTSKQFIAGGQESTVNVQMYKNQ